LTFSKVQIAEVNDQGWLPNFTLAAITFGRSKLGQQARSWSFPMLYGAPKQLYCHDAAQVNVLIGLIPILPCFQEDGCLSGHPSIGLLILSLTSQVHRHLEFPQQIYL